MRLRNNDFFHFIDDLGTFTDVSVNANEFQRDTYQIVLGPDQTYYVGLYKPFKQFYVELNVNNTPTAVLEYKYWNGSSFVNLPNTIDLTQNFTRSDFVSWQFEDDSKMTTDWQSTSINGQEAYWIEITSDIVSDITLEGINIVFSNDIDLQTEFPRIKDFLDPDRTSFINFHVAARDEIVQHLRSGGSVTNPAANDNNFLPQSFALNGTNYRQISKWDFLDIEEIRDAAKFMTLSKIFFYVSENNQDKSFTRSMNFKDMFGEAFKLFYLSLDFDDDGNNDAVENLQVNDIRIEIL